MRVVFMGTPQLAAAILREVAQQHEVACVYTRPDAVRGRGGALSASPVKAEAERLGLPVRTPKTLRDADEQRHLAELAPDAVCVAAYGCILPAEVLAIPRYGCLNVHASLLPRWRGAAPIERAILAGDEQTGVCIMRMEEGLDTGPYCVRRATEVEGKSAAQLTAELAGLGARALLTGLSLVEQGDAEWTAQDEAGATYAEKLAKGELDCDPALSRAAAQRRVLASSDAHPSRAQVAGRAVTLLETAVAADERAEALAAGIQPGEVRFSGKRLFLGCADGALEVRALKPDGKKPMDARSFAAGVQGIKAGGFTWERVHA
ncbi:MAG TPA: methionyl-tRNA formyltransferase [Candidatus Aphodovivens avistercoris]|nr:methionyl-tRNA formyltransferase [Candidatus Aphodovivens avistercoris]